VKTCRICKKAKPYSDFYKMSGMRDGHRNECKDCNLARRRAKYRENPEPYIRRTQRWRENNPDRYMAYKAWYRETHKEQRRVQNRSGYLRRKYGLAPAEFDFLVVAQAGRCAICNREDGKELRVDHDHKTGIVRGLLCGSCNRAMGLFHEDPNRFRSAEMYLLRSQLMLGCGDKKTR
jgi:hypothetical protein